MNRIIRIDMYPVDPVRIYYILARIIKHSCTYIKVGREGNENVSKDKSDICIKDQSGNDLIQRFKITNTKADLELVS